MIWLYAYLLGALLVGFPILCWWTYMGFLDPTDSGPRDEPPYAMVFFFALLFWPLTLLIFLVGRISDRMRWLYAKGEADRKAAAKKAKEAERERELRERADREARRKAEEELEREQQTVGRS